MLLHPKELFIEFLKKGIHYNPNFTTYFGTTGSWQVFQHEYVKEVLSNTTHYSNKYTPKIVGNPLSDNMNQQDPPDHTRLKLFMNKTFTSKLVKDLEVTISAVSQNLIDNFRDNEEVEFVTAFAEILPNKVISQALGINNNDHTQVATWVKQIAAVPEPDTIAKYYQCQQEILEFLNAQVDEKKQISDDGLISQWLNIQLDNDHLTTEEVVLFCMNLYLGGSGTLSGLLELAIYTLAEYPELQTYLAATDDDIIITSFIEEVLRFRAPVPTMYRKAKCDIILDGKQIKEGDIITVWLGAANRDPKIFHEPDSFLINRGDIANSLSLGFGPHYCVGSHLVKTEARIAIKTILRNIKEIKIKPGTTPNLSDSLLASTFNNLWITFEKK